MNKAVEKRTQDWIIWQAGILQNIQSANQNTEEGGWFEAAIYKY